MTTDVKHWRLLINNSHNYFLFFLSYVNYLCIVFSLSYLTSMGIRARFILDVFYDRYTYHYTTTTGHSPLKLQALKTIAKVNEGHVLQCEIFTTQLQVLAKVNFWICFVSRESLCYCSNKSQRKFFYCLKICLLAFLIDLTSDVLG